MQRIAIVGPESSGKTTLCEALAGHYAALWVEEYAREHLAQRNGIYVEDDLRMIASLQYDLGQQPGRMLKETPLMLFDTDMITIMIWSREKFGHVHQQIMELVERAQYDHWLLCRPDIPWEADPLRENPHDRDRLLDVHEKTLKELQKPYTIIEGEREQRLRKAIQTIDALIENDPVKEREV